jgi:sporulation protein YlmC with PRC-barrel domain
MAPTMTERSADRATTGTTQKAATSFKTPAGDLRAAEIIGSTVYDVHNRNIGSVKDIVLDKDGKVSNVVVDVGAFLGMGGKYVAVALNDIKMDNDRLTLNRTKEELEAAKEFQLQPKNG